MVRKGFETKLKNFLENRKIDGSELLLDAVKVQKESSVKLLLDQQLDINYQDEKGNTALHYAAELDSNEILNLLLEHKANVEISNDEDMTALQMAVYKGKVQNYETLAKVTSDQTQKKNKSNDTLLHLAVCGQNLELVKKFADDVNLYYKTKWDRVPLYFAACRRSSEILNFLITKMENLKDDQNSAMFEEAAIVALKGGLEENYFLLRGYLNQEKLAKTILLKAIEGGNAELFRSVFHDVSAYCMNELDHFKMYEKVTRQENYAMCKALIDVGFNIHATDERKNTPLHAAAWNSACETFSLLIERGADPNAFNSASMAPICTALSYFDCNEKEQNESFYYTIKKLIDSHKCENDCSNILKEYENGEFIN